MISPTVIAMAGGVRSKLPLAAIANVANEPQKSAPAAKSEGSCSTTSSLVTPAICAPMTVPST